MLVFNRPIDRALAERLNEQFIEVLLAPGFGDGAMEILTAKESIRILEVDPEQLDYTPRERDVKRVRGGLLVQDADRIDEDRETMTVPTEAEPTEEQWEDLLFAWRVCRHVRSNAIVFARDGATVGIGAGQMSRVDSVRIAIDKAADAFGERATAQLAGSVVASDAFFPFADGPQAAIDAGATALIQPGRLEARRRGGRRLQRGVGGDGVHRPAPLPPLTRDADLDVLRVFCAADGSGGNPLGVFFDGSQIPEPRRQEVARDLGFAETVFVDDRERAALRIFTPEVELPLAGHPLVGSAWLLRERGFEPAVLRPPAGDVSVRFDGELTAISANPEWGPPFEFVQLGSPAEVDALHGSSRGLRAGRRLGVARPGRGADPRAGLRPGGRRRRGRGDRLGRIAALRPARPRDRDPPGPRLGPVRGAGRRRDRRGQRPGRVRGAPRVPALRRAVRGSRRPRPCCR